MPIYVYECSKCGEFEEHQSISASPLEKCPQCGGPVKKAVPQGTSFIMKGKGAAQSCCDRHMPCCGRDVRCDRPPCGK